MAFISFKALASWFQSVIILILVYFLDLQKLVTVTDFEYLKNKGVFILFSFYFLSTVVLHIFKIMILSVELKIKIETLKAKEEIRKYIENKNKKNL